MTVIRRGSGMRALLVQVTLVVLCFFTISYASEALTPQEVIRKYNEGVITAARTSKSDHLYQFADKKIVTKFHTWLKSWHDNNLFMDAKLKSIQFLKTDITNNHATITTSEEWTYRYIDIKTRQIAMPATAISYTIRYELTHEQGKWYIKKIDVINETKK